VGVTSPSLDLSRDGDVPFIGKGLRRRDVEQFLEKAVRNLVQAEVLGNVCGSGVQGEATAH
jgi:hypothetical protein